MVFIYEIVLLSHTYDGNQRCEMEGYGDRNRSIGKQKKMDIPFGDRDQQKKEDSKSGGEDATER